MPSRARIVLLGMRSAFTAPALAALLEAPDVDLRAIVLAGSSASGRATPIDRPEAARANGIPVHEARDRAELDSPAFRATLEAIAPDLIVVACFPWRVPGWLRSLPAGGCVNIHPSLLPDGRGPEPVYWAFRWNLAETGVSLHLVDAGLDTGPIVAQRGYTIPEDATLKSLEGDLARLGASLLIDRLPAILNRSVTTIPQDHSLARHAPFPGPDDLVAPTSWPASQAARFIRAIAPSHGPVPVLVQATGQRLAVSEVVDVTEFATIPEAVVMRGSVAQIRFSPGVLTCRLGVGPQSLRLHRSLR